MGIIGSRGRWYKVNLLIGLLLVSATTSFGEEDPVFWTTSEASVQRLTLSGGLETPLSGAYTNGATEMRYPNWAILPFNLYSPIPIPSPFPPQMILKQMNVETGEVTPIAVYFAGCEADPTFDAAGHLLTVSLQVLYDLDLVAGTRTEVPLQQTVSIRGLASYGGILYAIAGYPPYSSYSLIEIEPKTGAWSTLFDEILPEEVSFVGMDFDADGLLWIAFKRDGNLEVGRVMDLNDFQIEPMGSFPTDTYHFGLAVTPRGDSISIPSLGTQEMVLLIFLISCLGVLTLRSHSNMDNS